MRTAERTSGATAPIGGLLAAFVVAATVPTALWPIYETRFGFGTATTTLLFVCYVFALLATTLLAGAIVDAVGARRIVSVGVGVAMAAAGLLAVAPGVAWLAVARLGQGIAVGAAGPALTAALVAAAPGDRGRGSLSASILLTAGSGLGPLLSSLLSAITVTGVVGPCVAALALVALFGAMGLPRLPGAPPAQVPYRSRVTLRLPIHTRRSVLVAASGSALAWAIGYAALAVAPSFAVGVLHRHDAVTLGAPAGLMLVVSAAVQWTAGKRPRAGAGRAGLLVVVVGLAGLATVPLAPNLVVLVAALSTLGVGHGLVFSAALREVATVAEVGADGATFAVFFAVTQLGAAVPVLTLGALSVLLDLSTAVQVFCAAAGLVAVVLTKTRKGRAW